MTTRRASYNGRGADGRRIRRGDEIHWDPWVRGWVKGPGTDAAPLPEITPAAPAADSLFESWGEKRRRARD